MKNFPDWFFNQADWQEKTLGDVAKKIIGGFGFSEIYQGNKNMKIPFYKVSDMNLPENSTEMLKANNYVSEEIAEKMGAKIFNEDGIIFAKVGAALLLNRKRISKAPFLIDNNMMTFIPDKNFLDLQFAYQYFLTLKLDRLSQVGALPSFNTKDVAEIKIKIPPLETQKKIADYFTHLDNAINAQDLKLKSWRDAKKAMLQKIFSQEFYFTQDNGEKYPAWQEKTLGEIAEKIIGGGTPDTANRNFYAGNVTWISSSDLKENDVHKISKTRFITEDAIKNSATKKIPPKSILIVTRVGVGKVALSDEILCTSQDFTNLILKENFLSEFFVYQIAIKMKIAAQQTQGTAIKGITTDEVKKIKIKIPCLEEQKKIADYFSSLDKIIDAENKILENLRQMKRGLLQKLFV